MLKRTTLSRRAASRPAIAEALAPTNHPHPLLTDQAREHTEPQLTSAECARPACPCGGTDLADLAAVTVIEVDGHQAKACVLEDTLANFVEAAETEIRTAVRVTLAGLTTHPRDVAEQLHQAVDDASAEHLARPDVGDTQLDEARSVEAISTAWEAMDRALALSTDRARTVRALRNVLNMAIAEAGA